MNKFATIGITNILDPFDKLSVPINLGNGVWLEPFTNWYELLDLKKIYYPEMFPDIQKRKYAYTYYHNEDDERISLELLTITSLSIWLSKSTDVGFDFVVTARNVDNWEWKGKFNITPILNSNNVDNKYLDDNDLKIAQKINETIFYVVMSRDIYKINSLRIAIWSLFKAITTDMHSIPIRYLILWVAFEAIFGPKKNGSIKEKIATRHSKFMSNSDENIKNELYEKTRKGYKWRSKIVHGDQIGSNIFRGEEFSDIYKFTETSIRESVKKILLDNNLVKIFCSNERENYLDSLK